MDTSGSRWVGTSRRELTTFLALTFGLSSLFYFRIVAGGGIESAGALTVLGLMACPGVAALAARLAFRRNLRGLGWRLGRWRDLGAGYALPLVYGALAYGLVWLASSGAYFDTEVIGKIAERLGERWGWSFGSDLAVVGAFFLLIATRGVFFNCIFALGEEIGWRGLLVPVLAERYSFTRTAVISGIIWSVWHWPLILVGGYEGGSPLFGLVAFTVMAVAASIPFAWLRLRGGSVWPAVILHGSHNAFLQGFFDPLTRMDGPARYLAGEFGAVTAVAVALVAWMYWRCRGDLARP